MTRRMIDSGMWSNENFAALPAMARLLQIGIINHADDQGRIKAHPAYLRSQIFPYDDVGIDDVQKWLQLITKNGTAIIYEVDGKDYLQLVKWWDYQSLQYASPSEYPAPGAWQDRIRYNAKGAANLVLTHNWTTSKGDTLPNTCDHKGNPSTSQHAEPPSQPPSAQGGEPPSEPPSPPNKLNLTKEELNTTEGGDRACDPEPALPPTAPPLASHRCIPADGEYIPGVKRPQYNQAKRNADTFMADARKHNIGPEPFRRMLDAILEATGKSALANTNGDLGQQTLNQAKQTVIDLAEMGRVAVEDVEAVLDSWRNDDYRGASCPTFRQIVEHASAMAAGTHITVRRAESGKKEFASLTEYNEWAVRNDPEYKRITEGVLIRGTVVKRAHYQPMAVAH